MKAMTPSVGTALLGLALAIPLTACDSRAEPDATRVVVASAPAPCSVCGTISQIQKMTDEAESSGVGIVLGAVAGAVVGHQIGDGKGQDAATVIGAVGGGIAGNEIEKHVKGTPYFHVTIAMDNGGGTRTVNVTSMNGLVSGSRVKIVGNNLQALG
jgi:outer membrane lipoprotein SlyB